MRKKIHRIVAILLCVCMFVSLTGCGKRSAIKDTLDEFEYSCSNLDLNAILNCINPSVADPIKLGLVIYSTASGNDYEDVLDDLVKTLFGEYYNAREFLGTISITDRKIKIKKDTATVECILHFEVVGVQFNKETTITMVESNKEWYISSIQIHK